MEKDHRFYRCEKCGNLIGMIHHAGPHLVCCGEEMTELEANTSEGTREKHLPVVRLDGNHVDVEIASEMHPMNPEHHIEWVYLQTSMGGQRKGLDAGMGPRASFSLSKGEHPIAAFAYCNRHGLWKSEIE